MYIWFVNYPAGEEIAQWGKKFPRKLFHPPEEIS